MKNIFYLLGLIFLILSCNDKDEPKFIDQPADDVTYQVYLTDNQISGYKKYIKDEFAEKADYYDSDSLTQMIRTSAAGEIIEKVSYEMSDNNLALSATDSIFRPGLIYVATMDYEYQDGFMIKSNVHWKNIGDNTDSGIFTVTKTIENENIVSVNNSFPNWISGCTNYFEYGDQLNKLDIQSLTPGITGKISKNLIAQATWNNGCPCGPSSSIPSSTFQYKLNNDGYVTKMIETYTPCYHLNSPGEVIRTVKTTIFEYDLR